MLFYATVPAFICVSSLDGSPLGKMELHNSTIIILTRTSKQNSRKEEVTQVPRWLAYLFPHTFLAPSYDMPYSTIGAKWTHARFGSLQWEFLFVPPPQSINTGPRTINTTPHPFLYLSIWFALAPSPLLTVPVNVPITAAAQLRTNARASVSPASARLSRLAHAAPRVSPRAAASKFKLFYL